MSEKSKDVQDMMEVTMQKIKEMVDVSTIVGEPINTPDGTTIIPISKVSFGFGAGGSDFDKNSKIFGGAGGAGVTIQPLGFLVVANGDVKMLPIDNPSNAADRAVGLIPEIINTVADLFKKKTDDADETELNETNLEMSEETQSSDNGSTTQSTTTKTEKKIKFKKEKS